MDLTATYSPEDNKLRLYSSTRLSTELFNRVKTAGFRWAPRQELFVAPMWTPSREDFLVELCGFIDDEDSTLIDRAEERSERFEEYSEHRAADADRAHKTVSAIMDHIPMGQPILVGHHSERRHRRDLERMDAGMRKAVSCFDKSEYWQRRAASALAHAKYKERPDVRARRIRSIEADKRKSERSRDEATLFLKLWTTCQAEPDADKQKAEALQIASRCHLTMPRKEGDRKDFNHNPSAYDALSNNYPELYASRSVDEVIAYALTQLPKRIAHTERWIAHYSNRIAYERAMLAEAGGTATDQTRPEVGGACRCWASPSNGWSFIQKVNKVTVTVLDNWHNGGPTFSRTIRLDKLSAVMSPAQVQEKRDAGVLIETDDKRGFLLTPSTVTA